MKNFAARAISFIFHPSFVAILATFLITLHSYKNLTSAFLWAFVMVFIVLAVFAFELYGIKKGFFSDLDVSKRNQRRPLFIFVFIMVMIFMVGVFFFHGPKDLLAGGIYIIVGIVIFLLVNKQIKASVHVGALSAFFVSMALLFGGMFYLGLLFIPLISWSRVVLHRHTIPEVVVGASLGISLTVVIYIVIQYFNL